MAANTGGYIFLNATVDDNGQQTGDQKMHPLKVDQPYPYNCWWVAAYSSEVTREILGQTILGERVIFYRTEAGEAVALVGICPHRSFPLANSWLVGDAGRVPVARARRRGHGSQPRPRPGGSAS